MTHRDVVAVGASAGGVEALRAVVSGLPADLPAAVLVVLHVPRDAPSALPRILSRSGPLPARTAVDGEPVRPGQIYVAPADHHLLVLDHGIRISRGPAENGHRPAVDPLFRSVARAAGPRGIAVVLSGNRDDGASGAAAVAARGGRVVVQAPEEALYSSMPRAALTRVEAADIAEAADLGRLLGELTTVPIPDPRRMPDQDTRLEQEVAISDFADLTTDQIAAPAGYGCPSCGGSLFEMESDPLPRYRCRVGHAWTGESLLGEQAVQTEGALWLALRALEEKAALSRRMAGNPIGRAQRVSYARIAEDAEHARALLRTLLDRLAAPAVTQGE